MGEGKGSMVVESEEAGPGFWADLVLLTKARLSLMVVFTTAIGFVVGGGELFSCDLIFAVVGTSLAACSAAALNQWWEADVDGLMDRTRNRPVPAGRISRPGAAWLGLVFGALGVVGLFRCFGWVPAILALTTIVIYLLVYTPMKRRSAWCTIVGAVSGAIPPVIGCTAAGNRGVLEVAVLFGILFLWQIPHFLAIAWICSDEYRAAGFVMLPPSDVNGRFTGAIAFSFTVALSWVTLVPVVWKRVGGVYPTAAVFLDCVFLGAAFVFFRDRSRLSARRLFLVSILYLPLMLALLALCVRW
jgi:protoheme IX farnesyltransferase